MKKSKVSSFSYERKNGDEFFGIEFDLGGDLNHIGFKVTEQERIDSNGGVFGARLNALLAEIENLRMDCRGTNATTSSSRTPAA